MRLMQLDIDHAGTMAKGALPLVYDCCNHRQSVSQSVNFTVVGGQLGHLTQLRVLASD